jgi:hypothetical protein
LGLIGYAVASNLTTSEDTTFAGGEELSQFKNKFLNGGNDVRSFGEMQGVNNVYGYDDGTCIPTIPGLDENIRN